MTFNRLGEIQMHRVIGLSALLSFAVATTSHTSAAVISDFEPGGTYYGGTEGWFNYDGQAAFSTYTNPAGGTGTWLGFQPQQYWGKITLQTWATPDLTGTTLAENTQFELDLIVDSGWLPNTSNINLTLQLNGIDFSFNQAVDTSSKNTVRHLVFDYSSIPAATSAAATTINISVNMFPGYDYGWDGSNPSVVPYAPRIYYDNFAVTAVPEPASLALTALPALALLRRRR